MKRYFIPLMLFILTVIVAGCFSLIGVDPHHDGVMFKPALDVARGSMLFRDTFTQYGAFTTILQAWALMIFGPYVLTIQLLTAFFYGLIAVLLYEIYRKILPLTLSVITVLLWIFMAPHFMTHFLPWASVYALFFQLLGTYLLIIYEERADSAYLFWAGVATAFTLFTRQPGGIFMLLAVYAYLLGTWMTKNIPLKKCIRSIFIYTCGAMVVIASFLIWITANGALRDFWQQSVRIVYNFGANRVNASTQGVMTSLFPGGRPPISLWALFPVVTILISLVCVIALARKQHSKRVKTVCIIAAIGLSAWLQYHPVTDDRHVYWGGAQMFGLLSLALYTLSGYLLRFAGKLRSVLVLVFTCILLAYCYYPYVSYRLVTGQAIVRGRYVTVSKPEILRGLLLSETDATFYSAVADAMDTYFRENPNGNVVNLSRDALFVAFDPRIRNIHPLYVNWWENYAFYPDFPARIYTYIEKNKPLVVGTSAVIPKGYCPIPIAGAVNDILLSKPCP